MIDRIVFWLAVFFIPWTLVTLVANIKSGENFWVALGFFALVLWIFNIVMSWPTKWKPLKK